MAFLIQTLAPPYGIPYTRRSCDLVDSISFRPALNAELNMSVAYGRITYCECWTQFDGRVYIPKLLLCPIHTMATISQICLQVSSFF